MEILKNFQQLYKPITEIYCDYSTNFDEIKNKILIKLDINLNDYTYDLVERETTAGYKMKYHRDNYMLRKFNDISLFIPFNEYRLPVYSLIWYRNSDFTGGSLEFLCKKIYKPRENLFVFFDSNDIHRVNEQLTGTRKTKIYKFYSIDSIQ